MNVRASRTCLTGDKIWAATTSERRVQFLFERFYVISIAVFFVLVTFTYAFFVHPNSLLNHWSVTNVTLLYATGIMFSIGLIGAVATDRPVLTASMFFCYAFYFVALREQVIGNWDRVLVADQQIVTKALLLVMAFGLIVLLVSALPQRMASPRQARRPGLRSNNTVASVLIGCLFVQILLIAYLGPAIFSNRLAMSDMGRAVVGGSLSTVIGTTIGGFVYPILYFIPLVAVISIDRRRDPFIWSLAAVSLVLGILLNNPMIHARYYVGTLIAGTALLVIRRHLAGATLSILIGGILVAPALHVFRGTWQRDELSLDVLNLSGLRSLDFDAFTMICYGLIYHAERGILYGANVVSSLFFFVPRSMWPAKAVPTGGVLYETVMLEFRGHTYLRHASNLSAPIPIEGFLAFGWLGVAALSLAFGAAVRWLDGAPRLSGAGERSLSIRVMWLAYAPVMFLFLARGALLPTFAYAVGVFGAIFVAVRLLRAPERASPKISE